MPVSKAFVENTLLNILNYRPVAGCRGGFFFEDFRKLSKFNHVDPMWLAITAQSRRTRGPREV